MAVTSLDSGKLIFSNAAYLRVTPYESEDKIGTKTYDLVSIVGDTLSFTPDDNTINSKEWEFGDTPLVETVTLGKIQFAATCVDFQNEILKNIFGWIEGDKSKAIYAPNAYKDIYALVEVGFTNEDVVLVVPKLKLNSKAVVSTLKTGTGEGQLAGTAYAAKIAAGQDTDATETPMGIIPETAATYKVTVGSGTATVTMGDDTKYAVVWADAE